MSHGIGKDVKLTKEAEHRRHACEAEHHDEQYKRPQRLFLGQGFERPDVCDRTAIFFHREDEGECADVHGHIDRHIDQHRLHTKHGARRQAHERKAHVCDGGVCHQTLDVALTALEGLREGNKSVGIISHVEALKERITTQIVVTKVSSGHSTLSVIS